MNCYKNAIVSDILEINNTVNLKEVVFVGHNPVLENKCLKKLFPENNVEPLISNTIVSLSKLTGKIFNIPYFNRIKKSLLILVIANLIWELKIEMA